MISIFCIFPAIEAEPHAILADIVRKLTEIPSNGRLGFISDIGGVVLEIPAKEEGNGSMIAGVEMAEVQRNRFPVILQLVLWCPMAVCCIGKKVEGCQLLL